MTFSAKIPAFCIKHSGDSPLAIAGRSSMQKGREAASWKQYAFSWMKPFSLDAKEEKGILPCLLLLLALCVRKTERRESAKNASFP